MQPILPANNTGSASSAVEYNVLQYRTNQTLPRNQHCSTRGVSSGYRPTPVIQWRIPQKPKIQTATSQKETQSLDENKLACLQKKIPFGPNITRRITEQLKQEWTPLYGQTYRMLVTRRRAFVYLLFEKDNRRCTNP